ncbi:MAG: sugar transferase [Pseudomonadota bacterium]
MLPTMESVGFTAFDEKRVLTTTADQTKSLPVRAGTALGGRAKRVIDLLIAAVALLALSPLLILVALAVRVSSPGSALYGHVRIGHAGHTFKCWKFRTMVSDGDVLLERYLAAHPEEREEWVKNRKLRRDPRVTRIGAVLRAYSVDELPQIFNVLLGEMSLVGPRPVVRDELEMYGAAARHYLHSRPGITGLWQVSGRSDTSYEQRVSFDTKYVLNWSLAGDLAIMARTIPAVLFAKGSY